MENHLTLAHYTWQGVGALSGRTAAPEFSQLWAGAAPPPFQEPGNTWPERGQGGAATG